MINVCPQCGQYHAGQMIDPQGPWAICPACGHRQRFRRLPLLLVCGPSGVGKSAVCRLLPERLPEAVVLEADVLWRDEFAQPEDNYRAFYKMWLRLCKNIAQSGRPVVLFSAGGIPGNIEPCSERRYLATVHYLALTCAEEVLLARLRRRPTWCGSADEAHLAAQVQFNRWLCAVGGSGTPPIALLDTTQTTVEATTAQVAAWARRIIAPGAL